MRIALTTAMSRIHAWISKLVDIPVADPDDARRRKVVNILMLIIVVVVLVQLAIVLFLDIAGFPLPAPLNEARYRLQGYIGSIVAIVLCAAIYAINRRSGWIAGAVLSLVVAVAIFTNTPDDPVIANATFGLGVSVVCMTLFVHSVAGIVMAALGTGIVALVGAVTGAGFYIASAFDLFGIALVCWFAARSLEQALKEVRVLNVELDQRVRDRTRDLAESLAKNQAILDSTADGVIVFDMANVAVVANPAMARLLGMTVEEIAGRSIEDLLRDHVADGDKELIINLLADTSEAHGGFKFRWDKKTFSVSIAPVRDNSGRVTGTVAVFRDFTREAEVDRMKSTFASIASHELRTPVNAIMGYAEILGNTALSGSLSPKQADLVKRIVANTGKLLSLANNLLDQAQIEAGRLTLEFIRFSPVELVQGVHGLMDVLAQSKGLKLTSSVAEDVPKTLYGDWQRLHQILVNLLNNAIKFTDEGAVSARVFMWDSDHWAMEVRDTGPGISPEMQAVVFDPFHRGDEETARKAQGAGLGLSIVKQLVELMGGRILLQSELGKGSTFTVILPVMREEEHVGHLA